MRRKQIQKAFIATFAFVFVFGATALAQTSSSNSYQVQEYQFGTGGNPDLNSTNYNANASVGSLGVGRSSSTNYDLEAGFITPSEPFLELFINTSTVNLGTLDTSTTATGNSVFWVRTYLSSSYVVQTMSPTLTSEGGATIDPMTTAGSPTAGTEQFGINLVANTSPTTFGNDLMNIPDNTYADGEIPAGYNTPNQYKYNQGDIIARAAATLGNQAVGRTDYTISYIANISVLTEAGSYTMVHDIVVVGTF